MNRDAMLGDVALCRRTERRTFVVSVTAHALLFVLLRMMPSSQPMERLTEISLLEAGIGSEPSAPAPEAPAAPAPQTQTGVLRQHKDEVRFRRASDLAESAPDPQSDTALEDRLSERLATLQSAVPASIVGLATVPPRAPSLASPAGMPSGQGTGGGAPLALTRGGAGGGGGTSPLALARGGGGGKGTSIGLAALPAEKPAARPTTVPARAGARSSLAGASLAGPIADRPVLESARPQYPEWAKSEAVEGSVTLYFVVSPDGRVQDNVLVQKTAGFQDFDDSATAALRAWRFAPLSAGHIGDQWGTITFHFKLAAAP